MNVTFPLPAFASNPAPPNINNTTPCTQRMRPIDQRTRSRPGLSSPQALFNHPLSFAATEASYFLAEQLRLAAQGTNTHHHAQYSPQEAAKIVKDFAHHYGALTVGITNLKPEHGYTHIGRGVGQYGDTHQSPPNPSVRHRFHHRNGPCPCQNCPPSPQCHGICSSICRSRSHCHPTRRLHSQPWLSSPRPCRWQLSSHRPPLSLETPV